MRGGVSIIHAGSVSKLKPIRLFLGVGSWIVAPPAGAWIETSLKVSAFYRVRPISLNNVSGCSLPPEQYCMPHCHEPYVSGGASNSLQDVWRGQKSEKKIPNDARRE